MNLSCKMMDYEHDICVIIKVYCLSGTDGILNFFRFLKFV